jgi:succinate-acetate transporter protein
MAGLTTNQGFVQGTNPDPAAGNTAVPAQEYWTPAGSVRGPLPLGEARRLAGQSMALIADPVPLGLSGLAAATWTISTVVAGWHGMTALAVAAPIAMFYGGVAQFLAGMWAFRRGNTLVATAFSSFGAFYFAFGAWLLMMGMHVIPSSHFGGSNAAYVSGWFIITFGVVAGYLAIAALAENWVLTAILATLCVTYIFDGVGIMVVHPNNWATYIGGYAGIVSSLLAFYLAAAYVINASFGRALVPTFATRGPGMSIANPSTGTVGDAAQRQR